jgi:diguanylate cyclase (GGDEF)-like protein/PAS domain S-box-containing protein
VNRRSINSETGAGRFRNDLSLVMSEELFFKAFSYLPNVMTLSTLEGMFIETNAAFTETLGYTREEAIGSNALDIVWIDPGERARFLDVLNNEGSIYKMEAHFWHKEGHEVIALISSVKVMIGGSEYILSSIVDITDRIDAQEALNRYRFLFDEVQDSIILINMKSGRIVDANNTALRTYGYTRDEMLKLNFSLLHGIDKNRKKHNARKNLKGFLFESLHRRKDGSPFYVEISSSTTTVKKHKYLLWVIRDISERKQAEALRCKDAEEIIKHLEELEYISEHDPLTGLNNRTYFEKVLNNQGASRINGILMCDIDGLKLVNDSIGYQAGDALLIAATGVLKKCSGANDILARVGGDEFAVLLSDTDMGLLNKRARQIQQEVEAYNTRDPLIPLSITVGVAFKEDRTISIFELIKTADNNMYRQKLLSSQSARSAIVKILMKTLEARDFGTENHAVRLVKLMRIFAHKAGFPIWRMEDLMLFSQFHDIGKVGVPDRILYKPGSLNQEEKFEMQKHCEIGYRIAQASPDLAPIAELILRHHEWWNGQGYPLGLQESEIPIECRMLSIVDAYDAMTCDRPYRKAMSHESAVEELMACRGSQFDPELVRVFLECISGLDD